MHKTEHIRLHSSYSIVTDSSRSIVVTEPTWHLKRVEDIPCSPSSSCYSSLYLEFGSKGSITWMNMVWTREHEYWEIHNIVLRSFWMQRLEQKSDAIKVWPSLHSAKQGRWLQTLFNIEGVKRKDYRWSLKYEQTFGVKIQNSSPCSLAASARAFMRPW